MVLIQHFLLVRKLLGIEQIEVQIQFDPFSTNAPLLYLLKTSENWRFPDVFKGYKNETLVKNGLINVVFEQVSLHKNEVFH